MSEYKKTAICEAIETKHLLQFYYDHLGDTGFRTVEPHMVAYNEDENLALSAWFVSGKSESQTGPGWRQYLMSYISSVTILPQTFSAPRKGYKHNGGEMFHSIQCAL